MGILHERRKRKPSQTRLQIVTRFKSSLERKLTISLDFFMSLHHNNEGF